MRRTSKFVRVAVGLSALALFATACGGDETAEPEGEGTTGAETQTETDTETETEGGSEAASGGEFSMYQCEPKRLIPQSTTESCGNAVLSGLFTPLVDFDRETVEPLWGDESPNAVAESIEANDDNTEWTITLKDWTFHDGTPVTAQNYVDAWNWGAYGPNAADGNYFFADIEGYGDLNPSDGEPTAETLSGLEAVDEKTIKVTLAEPFAQYPLKLMYTVFYPLPDVAFEDIEAYEEAPIGNGPFMMDGSWEHDVQVREVRWDDYPGEPAKADALTVKIYADINTAYNDLRAGELDIMDTIPPEQKDQAKQEFGDRYINVPSSYFGYIGIPGYVEEFDNPDLRKALSMAIDRQSIIDAILKNGTPADDMVAPVISGYREGACGEACTFNPEKAKELFDSAGGFEGTLDIYFNAGSGHEEVYEAVANMWKQNLGIEEVAFETAQFAEILEQMEAESLTGPYRLAWVMDYPSMQNYLGPILGCGGSSNYTGFCFEDADALVAEGNAAASVEEATALYQQADDIYLEELPIIPFYYRNEEGLHSENVSNVEITPFAQVDVARVTVNQ
jgi:oligopeptide transport system substrate-binding protein